MPYLNYYLDCEFIEDGKTIDLISIGIVSADDREYYAISTEFDPSRANQWVVDNVLNGLPPRTDSAWKDRDSIKSEILNFCDPDKYGTPVFWGEWCSYDWVVFCQIFGTMMDLPRDYPKHCNDIIQVCEQQLHLPSSALPPTPLETEGNHNALNGAKSVKERCIWFNNMVGG